MPGVKLVGLSDKKSNIIFGRYNMKNIATWKKIIVFLSTVFLLVNAVLFVAGYYFYNIIMSYSKSNAYSVVEYQSEADKLNYSYASLNKAKSEFVSIDSRYNYKIKGIFIKNESPTNNTVILLHGIGRDKDWSIMKYDILFLDNGFNVFVYDGRNHGESGGDYPSYGFYESDDLQTCISYIKEKVPGGVIGVHGESMGAAVFLLWAGRYDNSVVSFGIEDCGYSDLYELFYERLEDYAIPKIFRPLLLKYTSLICELKAGFALNDVSPINGINEVRIPILFIHGSADNFVRPNMAEEMFSKKEGTKELYLVQGAQHAKSINSDRNTYEEVIMNFYKKFVEK